jgi:lipopolysaccharide biosynthesis glycosyltransferase
MKLNKITIVVGFDQREAIAYHTFCQSILEKSTIPVQFIPLATNSLYFYNEQHNDGSNSFIYSRFLTPYICEFQGFAVFADGDMICNTDISELVRLFDPNKAVQLVKHDYKTKRSIKYFGNKNNNYPRKNWSSMVIFNCEHPANRILTPQYIEAHDGAFLHRFKWLEDDEIGELNPEWNYLAIEYPPKHDAKLIHYTLGTPCLEEFKMTDMSDIWWDTYRRVTEGLES